MFQQYLITTCLLYSVFLICENKRTDDTPKHAFIQFIVLHIA